MFTWEVNNKMFNLSSAQV